MNKKIIVMLASIVIIILVVIGFSGKENDKQKIKIEKDRQELSEISKLSKKKFRKKHLKNNSLFDDTINRENNNKIPTKGSYRYSNDPNFDQELLSGKLSDYNSEYRREFYAKKDVEVFDRQIEEGRQDKVEAVVEQFENVMDLKLGIDFSEEKREKIRESQRELQAKRQAVDKLFKDGNITIDDHRSAMAGYFEESLNECAKVLSGEEFELLFDIKKENIKNFFFAMINIGVQEE